MAAPAKRKSRPKAPPLPRGYGSIEALLSLLDLSGHCSENVNNPCAHTPRPKDALIVSIDTESERHGLKEHAVEIGVTILDTRDIYDVKPGPFARDWIDKTKTYHYVVDKTRRPVGRMRACFFAKDFFGSPASVRTRLVDTVKQHFHNQGSADRKLILVGHSVLGDVRELRHCPDMQLDLTTNLTPEIPISMIFDTVTLAHQAIIAGAYIPSRRLGKLVNWLGVHPQFRRGRGVLGWHNAGNDAAYTMMALLMLAVNWGHILQPGYEFKSGHGTWPQVLLYKDDFKDDVEKMESLASWKCRMESMPPEKRRHWAAGEPTPMGWWARICQATRKLVFGKTCK